MRTSKFINVHPFVLDDTKSGRSLFTSEVGGVHVSRIEFAPGFELGHHYHKETLVACYTGTGSLLVFFEDVKTKEQKKIEMQAGGCAIQIPTYMAFSIKNVGEELASLVLFSNKKLNINDNYPYKVIPVSC
tara:strand:- start:105 stop:497 length:393 start_codon:yes stop_codon:yes gene_type:complete